LRIVELTLYPKEVNVYPPNTNPIRKLDGNVIIIMNGMSGLIEAVLRGVGSAIESRFKIVKK
jgi:hypothetical protein